MQELYYVVISPSCYMLFPETASNHANQLHGPLELPSQIINLPGFIIFKRGIINVSYYVVPQNMISYLYSRLYLYIWFKIIVKFQVATLAQVLQQQNLS